MMGKQVVNWMGRHKKLMILSAVLIIVGIAGILLPRLMASRARSAMAKASYDYVRTTTLTKTSLDNTVTVTGTVEASDTATVTVSENAKTYKVASIAVKVGDTVRAGDVVATLDTGDLLDSIEKAKKTYDENVKSAQTSYDRAVSSYETSAVQHENKLIDLKASIEEADDKLSDAEDSLKNAKSTRNSAQSEYNTLAGYLDTAKAEISTYQEAYDESVEALNRATAALNEAKKELDSAEAEQENGTIDSVAEYEQKVTDAQADYDEANSKCATAKQELESIKQSVSLNGYIGYSAIESAVNSAYNTLTSAQNAVSSAETAVTNAEKSVKSAHDSYDNEKNSTSLTNSAQQVEDAKTKLQQAKENTDNLDKLNSTLDSCTLTATMNGTITSVGAVVGSPCSGSVVTIQNVNGLQVAVSIPASSASAVNVGMRCNISSDATEDTVSGTLTQIDPVANSSGSFGATVTVNGESTGLLVGIQAQVEIIQSSTEDVFVVPLDAVGTKDDGTAYILRKTGGSGTDMTFEEVTITVGERNDYYCEISGSDLNVGDVVRSSADLTAGIVNSENDAGEEQNGFDMGGFGGMGGGMPGGMPGGGGMPSGGMPSGGGGMPSGGGGSRPSGGAPGGM